MGVAKKKSKFENYYIIGPAILIIFTIGDLLTGTIISYIFYDRISEALHEHRIQVIIRLIVAIIILIIGIYYAFYFHKRFRLLQNKNWAIGNWMNMNFILVIFFSSTQLALFLVYSGIDIIMLIMLPIIIFALVGFLYVGYLIKDFDMRTINNLPNEVIPSISSLLERMKIDYDITYRDPTKSKLSPSAHEDVISLKGHDLLIKVTLGKDQKSTGLSIGKIVENKQDLINKLKIEIDKFEPSHK